jgi:hypothetical protein
MSLIDIVSIGISSVVMVILSKSRFHCKNECMSYSYTINLDINHDDDEVEVDESMSVDTFKTLPPPVKPKIQPLPTYVNFQTMKK